MKKWFIRFLIAYVSLLAVVALLTIIIDPYLHFHKQLKGISYFFTEERYVNDGIARQYDYTAVIIGTSMSQNFKPSEWEALTGDKTIKLPFSGGGFMEMREQLERAFTYNPNIRTVVWGIDYDALVRPYDFQSYEGYPSYLYDNNPFNDVKYVFNKDTLLHATLKDILNTLKGEPSMTLDEYASWNDKGGLDVITSVYHRLDEAKEMEPDLPKEQEEMVLENVIKNMSELVDSHPNVTFILFYPPYGLLHWDMCNREGWTLRHFEAEQIATEELLKHDNIKLYNFFDNYELTCNLDNYKDPEHYVASVNSWILENLLDDKWLVTKDNYLERMTEAHDFYLNYDFDSIFE